jgi:hypothetical protein
MADLIIEHELGSNEPILLNCAAILKGREHNDLAHGIYISLERSKGMSINPQTIAGHIIPLYTQNFGPLAGETPSQRV